MFAQTRRGWRLAAAVIGMSACLAAGAEEAFPARPITLVVPFGAGSAPDVQSRLIGQALGEQTGQTVIVQNRPGANSMIGTAYVANSVPADGYTILYATNSGISSARAMNKALNYDPIEDLKPVASLQETYFVLLARPDVAGRTFPGVVDAIRKNPDTFRIGGASVTMEVTNKLMQNAGELKHVYVPYKELSRMLMDLKGGVLEAGFSTIASALPLVQSGELVALATTSPERLAVLPGVPTMAETLPGVTLATWTGMFVPAATPPERAAVLTREIQRAVQRPEIQKLNRDGGRALTLSPEAFAAFIRADEPRWMEIFQAAGIEPQ